MSESSCLGAHKWSKLLPDWIWNNAGQLVEHPTRKIRICTADGCDHQETVTVRSAK